jgi:hypothetical protein
MVIHLKSDNKRRGGLAILADEERWQRVMKRNGRGNWIICISGFGFFWQAIYLRC